MTYIGGIKYKVTNMVPALDRLTNDKADGSETGNYGPM